jgi:hypothetical protein
MPIFLRIEVRRLGRRGYPGLFVPVRRFDLEYCVAGVPCGSVRLVVGFALDRLMPLLSEQ